MNAPAPEVMDMAMAAEPQTRIAALLVYQDMELERWGRELWDDLCRKLGENASFNYSEWKFEMLAHPALREIAAAEATEANFVLLAIRGDELLPAYVREWIDSVTVPRRNGASVLVTLLGSSSDETHRFWPDYPWVAAKARECGMGLIVYGLSRGSAHRDSLFSSAPRRKPEVQWSYAIVESQVGDDLVPASSCGAEQTWFA